MSGHWCRITDNSGTRDVWVEDRKRRSFNPAKDGRRFKDVKIGDQLAHVTPTRFSLTSPSKRLIIDPSIVTYVVVTDRWFDPVAGQHNASKGDMVAVQRLGRDGKPEGSKRAHTVRGLASQGYKMPPKRMIAAALAEPGPPT